MQNFKIRQFIVGCQYYLGSLDVWMVYFACSPGLKMYGHINPSCSLYIDCQDKLASLLDKPLYRTKERINLRIKKKLSFFSEEVHEVEARSLYQQSRLIFAQLGHLRFFSLIT